MKLSVLEALNVEEKEQHPVLILILQSFFIGIFYGSYDISAHTLFLTEYGETLIPRAYLLSGFVGILITSVYSFLQNKLKFSHLIFITLIGISIAALLMRLAFFGKGPGDEWLIFVVFILLGPLNIVTLVTFWGMVGRLFTLRQGKRLFGMIGSGQIFGIIVASYTIPLLPKEFSTENLLYISSVSMVIAAVIQLYIQGKFQLDDAKKEARREKRKKAQVSFIKFFKNRYIFMMSLFVLFSMLATFFISYSFLAVANDKYPNENSIKDFLGVFTGTLMIFGLLVKTFVYSKIMKTYGLKVSLLILPVLLVIFTLLSIFLGSFFSYNSEGESLLTAALNPAMFIFFFLIISISRLLSLSLRDSIELPAFKTLYQSLEPDVRHDVQAKIDGTVNEFSALFSGFLLLMFSFAFGKEVIYYSYVTIIILLLWGVITFWLFREYKKSLQLSIGKSRQEPSLGQNSLMMRAVFFDSVYSAQEHITLKQLKLARELNPLKFEKTVDSFLEKGTEQVKNYILEEIQKLHIYTLKPKLKAYQKKEKISHLNKKAQEIIEKIPYELNGKNNYDISALTKSNNISDRILSARLIAKYPDKSNAPFLMMLLRDYSPDVVHSSIVSASTLKNKEFCPFLVNYLESGEHFSSTYSALVEIGENAIDTLNNTFHRSIITKKELKRLIHIVAEISGKKAIKYLIQKTTFQDRYVVIEVLKALKALRYQVTGVHKYEFKQLLKHNIGITAWNINIQENLDTQKHSNEFIHSIEYELHENYEAIFLILSLLYDPQLIDTVREYLEAGTSESISYAVELLDIFIDEDLKAHLFPLLEDLPNEDRIKRLQDFYPLSPMSTIELLLSVLNRDYNFLLPWTKACALNDLVHNDNVNLNNDIIAHIFNPDPLIYELASKLCHKLDREGFYQIIQRLPKEKFNAIELQINNNKTTPYDYIYQKVLFLLKSNTFSMLPPDSLVDLAKLAEYQKIQPQTVISTISTNSLIPVFIITEGTVSVNENNERVKIFTRNDIIADIFIDWEIKTTQEIASVTEVGFFSVERESFTEWLFDYYPYIQKLTNE